MNVEKINLIIKNMELLIQSLKLEIAEESNVVKLEDLFSSSLNQKQNLVDTYEPDYYEER